MKLLFIIFLFTHIIYAEELFDAKISNGSYDIEPDYNFAGLLQIMVDQQL